MVTVGFGQGKGTVRVVATVLPLFALLALPGCAGNAILLDRGQDLSTAGAAAAKDVRTYLDGVQQQHLAANVALVASDPGCRWGDSIRVAMRQQYVAGETFRSLCLADGAAVPPGYSSFKLSLAPISKRTLEPTLALVVGVADYLEALDAVLARKTPDVAEELADARNRIEDARKAAATIGVAIPAVKPLSDAQVTAATDLLQLVADLAVEADKAQRVRRLESASGEHLQSTIGSLKIQVDLWQALWAKPDLQQAAQAYAIAEAAPWRPQDFESRRALIIGLVDARRAADSADALGAALKASLDKVVQAQSDLRRVMAGDLNEREKAERAAVIRKRLWRAFNGIGAVISAF